MSDKRKPKWDNEVDPARAISWFRTLCEHCDDEQPRNIQRALAPDTMSEDAYGKKIANSKFKQYADGQHVPRASFVEKVDQVVKGSSRALNHVLWSVLREQGPITKYAKGWMRELPLGIQAIVFLPDNELRLYGGRHYLGSLERRASVDGLAALTILLKLSVEAGEAEQAWDFAYSLFKVLIIVGPELDEQTIAERIFDLYVNRIFSLVSCNGLIMDLERYPFLEMAHLVGTLADKLRQQDGNYRVRKMPSYYALQILNGQRHNLKDLLQPPVKPLNPVP